jgi:hypothetical protein
VLISSVCLKRHLPDRQLAPVADRGQGGCPFGRYDLDAIISDMSAGGPLAGRWIFLLC